MRNLPFLTVCLIISTTSILILCDTGNAGDRYKESKANASFQFAKQREKLYLYSLGKEWLSPLPFPYGMEKYTTAKHTQSIAVVNSRDEIRRVPILRIKKKWQRSGGFEHIPIELFRSEKYRYVPSGKEVKVWVDNIMVRNSLGSYQPNRGYVRSYPNGTRFDDVLSSQVNNGVWEVFEHRSRQKDNGIWSSKVLYSDESKWPKGYNGLTVTCKSCHEEAGSGEYGEGLVPGGDTVISDPIPGLE